MVTEGVRGLINGYLAWCDRVVWLWSTREGDCLEGEVSYSENRHGGIRPTCHSQRWWADHYSFYIN